MGKGASLTTGFTIVWHSGKTRGHIEMKNGGDITSLRIRQGKGTVRGAVFTFISDGPCSLQAIVDEPEPDGIVTVHTTENQFSFFLRDVRREYPVFLPDFGMAVTTMDDRRSFAQISSAIHRQKMLTTLDSIENKPEENFASAASAVRSLECPTWLGLGRDIRIFEISFLDTSPDGMYCGPWIQPRFHGSPVTFSGKPVRYQFLLGRGIGCTRTVTRRLEKGFLPILTGTVRDEDIDYRFTAFSTLESKELTAENIRGTHYLVADGCGWGNSMTDEQRKKYNALRDGELQCKEETVLYFGVDIVNTGSSLRYAWIKNVCPVSEEHVYAFCEETGFTSFPGGKIFAVSFLNGKPLSKEEQAILLAPGESAYFEFRLCHQPVSEQRARNLAAQEFQFRRKECRKYWERKLRLGGRISLPERRINEMVKAGLIHLDLVAYGLEPNGPVAPCVGVYCPIGSESAPIIQFFDSMGLHVLAERSLEYFLEKQHPDGFMQNLRGYMLEPGAVLWSLGEHFRYTGDTAWAKRITPKILKSCEYIIHWRRRNMKEELRGNGYGMLEGKCADPEDPYHSFMLNGFAYLGLSRAAEILSATAPDRSQEVRAEAESLRTDIRESFRKATSKSPVIPLKNGSWCPTTPPWTESTGPVNLFAKGGKCFTHGTVTCRDSLLGPLWLVLQEVIGPHERETDRLLNYHVELMYTNNVAFSQPYYSRHDWVHLKRGEVKSFLKLYYNMFASLSDRETYTFWEQYSAIAPHKTHEEAWFLMQTRWMLWLEEGKTLHLLSGIPRAWLKDGQTIHLDDVASYFGPVSLRVESRLKQRSIDAVISCLGQRRPSSVLLRIPHPDGKRPLSVQGGIYDSAAETMLIRPFTGKASCRVFF